MANTTLKALSSYAHTHTHTHTHPQHQLGWALIEGSGSRFDRFVAIGSNGEGTNCFTKWEREAFTTSSCTDRHTHTHMYVGTYILQVYTQWYTGVTSYHVLVKTIITSPHGSKNNY